MPRRRQNRKLRKKTNPLAHRQFKVRRGPKGNALPRTPIVFLPNGGLPEKLYTTISYVETFTLTDSGVGGSASYFQFRLNSLFDNNYTGSGSQGYMRDQLAQYYSYAVIYGVKVDICVNGSNATTIPHIVTMRPVLSNSAPTDILLESERPHSTKFCLSKAEDKAVRSRYYKTHTIMGVKKSTLEDDQYRINIGNNPNQTIYLNICQSALPVDTSTATEVLYYVIKLKSYVKFYGRKDQAGS